MPTPGDNDARR